MSKTSILPRNSLPQHFSCSRARNPLTSSSMTKGRCVGLLGGLGVGAAVHYYQNLAQAHNARGRTLDLVMAHAETSRIFEYLQVGDSRGMAEYLNGFLHRLKAAG